MATFNTKEILNGSPSLISAIAVSIQEQFSTEGFEVRMDALNSGGYDISITKGNLFKAVLGMRTALKVTLLPHGNQIAFEAGVGVWGQQSVPTIISMFIFWPVLVTQIWGMIVQSRLDDKALIIARAVLAGHSVADSERMPPARFCPYCGVERKDLSVRCSYCGRE